MELGSGNSRKIQARTKLLQLALVLDGEMDVRRMVVRRPTELIGVFDAGMSGLNSLLREWEVAARDAVQVVVIADLRLHDGSFVDE